MKSALIALKFAKKTQSLVLLSNQTRQIRHQWNHKFLFNLVKVCPCLTASRRIIEFLLILRVTLQLLVCFARSISSFKILFKFNILKITVILIWQKFDLIVRMSFVSHVSKLYNFFAELQKCFRNAK